MLLPSRAATCALVVAVPPAATHCSHPQRARARGIPALLLVLLLGRSSWLWLMIVVVVVFVHGCCCSWFVVGDTPSPGKGLANPLEVVQPPTAKPLAYCPGPLYWYGHTRYGHIADEYSIALLRMLVGLEVVAHTGYPVSRQGEGYTTHSSGMFGHVVLSKRTNLGFVFNFATPLLLACRRFLQNDPSSRLL